MSRDGGFNRADVDTALLADPKVVRLARQVRDPNRIAVATCLYVGLVLASWKAGERVTLDESLPAWFLEPVDDVRASLAAAGLVDAEGRIPGHAWESWYEPAFDRRQATLDRWDRANKRRRGPADTAMSPRGDREVTAATGQDRSGPTGQDQPVQLHRAAKAARGGDLTRAGDFIAAPNGIAVDRV